MVNSFCEVIAIYYESFYCLSHCITMLESLLSSMLRDSPWPCSLPTPVRHRVSLGETGKPWKDWSCGAQPGQWGLGRSPSLLQEHTDTAHSDEPVWSPTCCFEEESGPGWYLSEAKEGKKNKTSYSCYKPNHPPYKRLFPHLHVRDNSKSVSAVRHEWKMKTKLLDIIK